MLQPALMTLGCSRVSGGIRRRIEHAPPSALVHWSGRGQAPAGQGGVGGVEEVGGGAGSIKEIVGGAGRVEEVRARASRRVDHG